MHIVNFLVFYEILRKKNYSIIQNIDHYGLIIVVLLLKVNGEMERFWVLLLPQKE